MPIPLTSDLERTPERRRRQETTASGSVLPRHVAPRPLIVDGRTAATIRLELTVTPLAHPQLEHQQGPQATAVIGLSA